MMQHDNHRIAWLSIVAILECGEIPAKRYQTNHILGAYPPNPLTLGLSHTYTLALA